jgi:hypothetical protein
MRGFGTYAADWVIPQKPFVLSIAAIYAAKSKQGILDLG